jgi:hypothetical protein
MEIFHFNNIRERILGNSGQSNRKILLIMVFSEGLVGNSNIGSLFYLTNMCLLVPVYRNNVVHSSNSPHAQ